MKKILKAGLISVFALAVFGLWLIALFHISNLWRGDSDNAFPIIAGNAILRGNFLLKGYYLSSLVTYFPVDLYLNALFIKILGFRTVLIHIIPIFIFLILIAVAIIYVNDAYDRNCEGLSFKIGLIMLFVFLAMPVGAFAFFMLQELHGSTIVLSLITILLFNKFIKEKAGSYIYLFLGFMVLTVTLTNDNLALVIAVIPLLAALAVFYYTDFKSRTALNYIAIHRKTKSGIKKSAYLSVLLAVILSAASKKIIIAAIRESGGFRLAPFGLPIAFVRLKYLPKNIYFFIGGLLRLLDANFFGKYLFSKFTFIILTKFLIIGLVLIYTAYAITVKFKKRLEETNTNKDNSENNFINFIDLTLLFGIMFLTAAFLLSDIALSKASARYLTPAVVYGLILALRNIPEVVSKYYERISFKIIGAIIIVVYASSFIYAALTPIPKSPFRPLGNWLEKHGLKYGYGSYFDSGIITLMSDNKIKVRQVVSGMNGKIVQYKWVSNKNWYKKNAVFVIYSEHFIYGGIDKGSVINTFGKPSRVYVEDFQGTIGRAYGRPDGKYTMPPYVIMVYKNGIRIDEKEDRNGKKGKHAKHGAGG